LFYQAVLDESANLPIPRCYDAAWDEASGQLHVLLEDLSQTHDRLEPPIPPAQDRAKQSIDCLADLHAHFWQSLRLALPPFKLPEPDSGWAAKHYPGFCDMLDDNLSAGRRMLFEKVITALPRLDHRLVNGGPLTLTHCDAHAWNFLYPRDSAHDIARLLDWEALAPTISPT